jgi:UDP-N-acetylglucosamine/UDP-N-acetylgalactosamine diphosphorylase
MISPPADLAATLARYGQSHLLAGWDGLSADRRTAFADELRAVDFTEITSLYGRRDAPPEAVPTRDRMAPLPAEPWDGIGPVSRAVGERALQNGEVACLVVAGGQGTRLGATVPKGLMPVGPVSGASLFQIHAEKVANLRQTYGGAVPLLVMTSPATHADTAAYFADNRNFGLDDLHVFQQGTMPALDAATGRALLDSPGKLSLSPNGHGGALTALADSGLLAALDARGVRTVFYFQVDNPLVRVGDPAFVGRHLETKSDVSSKVVFKATPDERVGILALVDGRCSIVEYSDLPRALAHERDANGDLAFRAGSPAIHAFSVDFLKRVTAGSSQLPYHVARKKVAYFDPATNKTVTPDRENALKFERFVFDALPLADRWLAVSVNRADEFAPLKNATGPDSADDVKRALTRQAARWLAAAGVTVPTGANGESLVPLEVSPNFAVTPEQFAARLPAGTVVTGATYWS